MSRLIESIHLKNGTFLNIEYHNRRMRRSRSDIFHQDKIINLQNEIVIPDEYRTGIFKCRVVYNENIDVVEFIPYTIKPVRSLKIVNGSIDYKYKFEDREAIKELFSMRGACDDILIVKDNRITDSSYSNIVFHRDNRWYTPSTPLLDGTKRRKLLDDHILIEEEITAGDMKYYDKASLINSMLDIGDAVIDIENIF